MTKIILKDDDYENVLIIDREDNEEFFDLLEGLICAYEDNGINEVRNFIEKWI